MASVSRRERGRLEVGDASYRRGPPVGRKKRERERGWADSGGWAGSCFAGLWAWPSWVLFPLFFVLILFPFFCFGFIAFFEDQKYFKKKLLN
jgi:hypothetical protein